MARKKPKTRKPARTRSSGPGPLRRWWAGLSDSTRRAIGRGALTVIALAATAAAVTWAMGSMRRFVLTRPAFAGSSARIVIADRPEWMSDWLADQIHCELLDGASGTDWTFDSRLARRVHDAAARCPWVRRLHEVRIERGPANQADSLCAAGRIVVRADWRRPVAMGMGRNTDQYIDAQGFALPAHQVRPDKPLMRIIGLAARAPRTGERWNGADVTAGLRMIRLLQTRPYADQITAVDVSNINLRQNLNDPAIRLVAVTGREMTEIRFGDLPADGAPPVGPSIRRRLDNLEGWYNRNQQRLAETDCAYVELRFGDIRIPQPAG